MVKKIDEIKRTIENTFTVSNIEWDSTALAFYIKSESEIPEKFELVRKKLRNEGYLAALRIDESPRSVMAQLPLLVTTPQLAEAHEKIELAQEQDVKRAWLDRFIELASCPDCQSHLVIQQGIIGCSVCGWGLYPEDMERHVIVVTKSPKITPRSVRVNIILLICTIITTTITGSTLWMGYRNVPFGSFTDTMITATTTPEYLAMGALFFSLPLMAILGTHELGHYFMSKHYGINASLPFFIPIPPGISPLGTMGAFISMREPMPNKKALFDIGIAGPIAGLLVAIPVTIIGFLLTEPVEHVYTAGHGPNVAIGFPLLFYFLYLIFPPDGGLHPTAFAGWVGLFITALNLLPAGQLDGGHVARALMGEKSKFLSFATLGTMLLIGFFVYPGWVILGALILMLGAYHPPPLNDLVELDMKRKVVGVFSVVLLILCITPQPLVPLSYDLHAVPDALEADIEPGLSVNFTLIIENTGEVNNTYDIINKTIPEYWNVTYSQNNITLPDKEWNDTAYRGTVFINIRAPENATVGTKHEVSIQVRSQNESAGTFSTFTPKEKFTFILHVKDPYDVELTTPEPIITVSENTTDHYKIFVNNTGTRNLTVETQIMTFGVNSESWNVTLKANNTVLGPGHSRVMNLTISWDDEARGTTLNIAIIAYCSTPLGNIIEALFIEVVCPEEIDGSSRDG